MAQREKEVVAGMETTILVVVPSDKDVVTRLDVQCVVTLFSTTILNVWKEQQVHQDQLEIFAIGHHPTLAHHDQLMIFANGRHLRLLHS